MLKRLVRLVKSWVGYFVSFAEDPEVMLQQAAEEMRTTLPRLNQVLISTRATAIRLADDEQKLANRERELLGSIKAALEEGSAAARSLAEDEASTLTQVREDREQTAQQREVANRAYENAVISVDEMKRRLREQILLAQRAVAEHRRATIMTDASSVLTQLDAYDTGGTLEKYLDQVKQKSAEARASMEIALGGGDLQRIKTERDVRKARAQGTLREIEDEIGKTAELPSGEDKQPDEGH